MTVDVYSTWEYEEFQRVPGRKPGRYNGVFLYYRCPECSTPLKDLDHNRVVKCKGCGAYVGVAGAKMVIADSNGEALYALPTLGFCSHAFQTYI